MQNPYWIWWKEGGWRNGFLVNLSEIKGKRSHSWTFLNRDAGGDCNDVFHLRQRLRHPEMHIDWDGYMKNPGNRKRIKHSGIQAFHPLQYLGNARLVQKIFKFADYTPKKTPACLEFLRDASCTQKLMPVMAASEIQRIATATAAYIQSVSSLSPCLNCT